MKRTLICFAAILIAANSAQAITLQELKHPKAAYSKLNAKYEPENKFKTIAKDPESNTNEAKLIQNKVDYTGYTYADISLNKLARELSQDLDMEKSDITEDVKTLWIGAATRSETISYAMYKLANPDEDKPKDNLVKKIIRPVANLTSVAGVGVSDPFLATSAMVSGNLMKALSSDDKEFNYKYSKVSDADMVILVRKIDDLQRELTDKYCDYMMTRKILKMAADITKKRKERTETMTNRSKNEILIADAYYRDALNFENKKRAEFLSKRSALEQLVGNESLRQFESNLMSRESQ